MKLKDLKIGTQLRLGLGLILTLLLGLGALSLRQTELLWQQACFFYHKSIEVRRIIGTLQADILAIRLEYRNYLLEESDQGKNVADQNIAVHAASAERQLHDLYEIYPGPLKDIDQARDAFVRWRSLQADNWERAKGGSIAKAMKLSKETGDVGLLRNELIGHISKISEFSRNKTDQFYHEAVRLKDALVQMLAFITATSFLFFLIVSWFLLKGIREPLHEFIMSIDRFRQGEKNVRIRYASTNEYGDLSKAFNEMAETLDTQAQINEQAARLAGVMLRELEARTFCREMLLALLEPTDSQIGAVYLFNTQKDAFECFESIGLSPIKNATFSATQLEGEFGMALATGRMQRITDIPENTPFIFTTVSGALRPQEIITLPLRIGQETIAVISLASIRSYENQAVRVLEVVSSTAAARMNGVLAYRQIQQLAEKLEYQNLKLVEQKQELEVQSDEMAQLNTELEMQKLQLEEANKIKSAFLSNMSHELRTPLNSVLALSRVLLLQAKEKLDAEEIRYLEIIERNGKNLLAMINDILDLAKIEASRMDVHPQVFSLALTLENVIECMTPLAEEKNINIIRDIPENLPQIQSDEIRVLQILQNLMSNAVKFTDQGAVTVSVISDGERIYVRIADTGIGITQDALEYIFEEFRQVDWSSSRRHEGTGLGLALARKTARMLGGDVYAQSAPGEGSTFTLMLPHVWKPGGPSPEPRCPKPPACEKTQQQSCVHSIMGTDKTDKAARCGNSAPVTTALARILLVEDNPDLIVEFKAVLEDAGYIVDVTRCGREAFEYLSRTLPDGIVLDLRMTEVDGFEVLENIRSKQAMENVPALILTANDLSRKDFNDTEKTNKIHYLVLKGDVNKESLLSNIKFMLGLEATGNSGKKKPVLEAMRPVAHPSQPPTILIVEDNPDNMTTFKAVLQARYRILEAKDWEKCLMVIAQNEPDLILLDMALPKTDGLTIVKRLKSDLKLLHVPIIAVTALAMQGDWEDILEAGCDDYILKPIDPGFFLKKIDEYFKR